MGIENSFVFAFGIKQEQLEDIISWGPGRSEQCELFLARGKRNNLIDDGSAGVSEYFRTGHDSDNFDATNLQVPEETSFHDAEICIESIEGKGVCKNQRNEKKPFLWSTAQDKFLAKPVVYSLSKVESMIDGYRRVVGEGNFLKKSFTENMNIPTKFGSDIKYIQDAEVESKGISEEKGTEIQEVILITSCGNLKSLPNDNNNIDINDTIMPYIPDYPFKTKAQKAFFGKEAKTFFVKITNKLELIRELCYRDDAYGMQNDNGMGYHKVDEMITDDLLMRHLAGEITMGAYTLWKDNTVRWICFDIDAHPDVDDSKYDMMAKINTAELHMIHWMQWLHWKQWV